MELENIVQVQQKENPLKSHNSLQNMEGILKGLQFRDNFLQYINNLISNPQSQQNYKIPQQIFQIHSVAKEIVNKNKGAFQYLKITDHIRQYQVVIKQEYFAQKLKEAGRQLKPENSRGIWFKLNEYQLCAQPIQQSHQIELTLLLKNIEIYEISAREIINSEKTKFFDFNNWEEMLKIDKEIHNRLFMLKKVILRHFCGMNKKQGYKNKQYPCNPWYKAQQKIQNQNIQEEEKIQGYKNQQQQVFQDTLEKFSNETHNQVIQVGGEVFPGMVLKYSKELMAEDDYEQQENDKENDSCQGNFQQQQLLKQDPIQSLSTEDLSEREFDEFFQVQELNQNNVDKLCGMKNILDSINYDDAQIKNEEQRIQLGMCQQSRLKARSAHNVQDQSQIVKINEEEFYQINQSQKDNVQNLQQDQQEQMDCDSQLKNKQLEVKENKIICIDSEEELLNIQQKNQNNDVIEVQSQDIESINSMTIESAENLDLNNKKKKKSKKRTIQQFKNSQKQLRNHKDLSLYEIQEQQQDKQQFKKRIKNKNSISESIKKFIEFQDKQQQQQQDVQQESLNKQKSNITMTSFLEDTNYTSRITSGQYQRQQSDQYNQEFLKQKSDPLIYQYNQQICQNNKNVQNLQLLKSLSEQVIFQSNPVQQKKAFKIVKQQQGQNQQKNNDNNNNNHSNQIYENSSNNNNQIIQKNNNSGMIFGQQKNIINKQTMSQSQQQKLNKNNSNSSKVQKQQKQNKNDQFQGFQNMDLVLKLRSKWSGK